MPGLRFFLDALFFDHFFASIEKHTESRYTLWNSWYGEFFQLQPHHDVSVTYEKIYMFSQGIIEFID